MTLTGTSCQGAVGGGGRVIFFPCESLFPGVKNCACFARKYLFTNRKIVSISILMLFLSFFRQFASRCLHYFQKGDDNFALGRVVCVKAHPKRVKNIAAGKVFA